MDEDMRRKRKAASGLKATVRMGKSGPTAALVDEIRAQLKTREAVKVKLLGTRREETREIAGYLADRCDAELVDVRGNTLVLWRKD